MKLNLQQKKYATEDNFRKIISIITGMMSSVDNVASQCLKDYDNTGRVYQRGSITIYDNYIWEALTVTQGAWDESKWTKIGTDDFTELDLDTIKGFLNLTPEQITNLQTLIDDTTITTTKTNSSSKIYMDIQAAIAECKDDTLKQIAKKVSGSYKIATSTAEVTSADYIYLINNGSNYDLYVLVEGNPTKVGDTSIDLSDYAKLTDLDNYYDKNTSDGKFALITTVNAHINDTVAHLTQDERDKLITTDELLKIANDTYIEDANNPTSTICKSNGDTLNTPYKEGITNASISLIISVARGSDSWNGQISISMASNNIYVRNKGADGWNTWKKFLTETDIVTTINNLSIDTQIPSAKAIYNKSKNKINEVLSGGDIIAYADGITSEVVTDTVRIMNSVNSPYGVDNTNNDFYYTIYNISDDNFKRIVAYDIRKNDMYMIMKEGGVWGKWQKVCTTSVADVPKTTINLPNISSEFTTGYIEFEVFNGVCYMVLFNLTFTNTSTGNLVVNIPGIPKRKSNGWHTITNVISLKPLVVNIGANGGSIEFYTARETGTSYYGTFSYPVAES